MNDEAALVIVAMHSAWCDIVTVDHGMLRPRSNRDVKATIASVWL